MKWPAQQDGFSQLELAIVLLIVVGIILALVPRIGDGLKWTHETAVRQTSVALVDNLELIAMKVMASNPQTVGDGVASRLNLAGVGTNNIDLNAKGFPVGTDWQANEQRSLRATDCEQLWSALLGPFAPPARQTGDSSFQVLTTFDVQHGLGCRYRYRKGGDMALDYFPDDGTVVVDARF